MGTHQQACTNNSHQRRPAFQYCPYLPWVHNCRNESSCSPVRGQFMYWPDKLWSNIVKAESKPILGCQYPSLHRKPGSRQRSGRDWPGSSWGHCARSCSWECSEWSQQQWLQQWLQQRQLQCLWEEEEETGGWTDPVFP